MTVQALFLGGNLSTSVISQLLWVCVCVLWSCRWEGTAAVVPVCW